MALQLSGVHGNVGRERPVLYMIQSRPDESGDPLGDAFGQLLESVRPELVRFAYWLARDRSVAEDVVQEAMLRAWRARSELKDAAAARHWLLTIVRREHARLYERKRLITVDVTEVVARGSCILQLRSRTPCAQHGFLYHVFSNRAVTREPVRKSYELGAHGLEKLAECISQALSALVMA